MFRLYCILIGYGFGLIQTSYLFGKMKGIDIREHGSGNAGTTNTLRVLGKKAGAVVFLGDILKCVFAVLLTMFLFQKCDSELIWLVKLYTSAGVILGHNFPFYMKFKGGKGIASSVGMMIMFHGYLHPLLVIAFFGVFILTKYVSLSAISLYLCFFVQVVVFGVLGLYQTSEPVLIEICLVSFFLTTMAIIRHHTNISRLLKGTENKTYLFHKKDMEGKK